MAIPAMVDRIITIKRADTSLFLLIKTALLLTRSTRSLSTSARACLPTRYLPCCGCKSHMPLALYDRTLRDLSQSLTRPTSPLPVYPTWWCNGRKLKPMRCGTLLERKRTSNGVGPQWTRRHTRSWLSTWRIAVGQVEHSCGPTSPRCSDSRRYFTRIYIRCHEVFHISLQAQERGSITCVALPLHQGREYDR